MFDDALFDTLCDWMAGRAINQDCLIRMREETYHEPNEEIEISQLTTFAGRLANLALEVCSMPLRV